MPTNETSPEKLLLHYTSAHLHVSMKTKSFVLSRPNYSQDYNFMHGSNMVTPQQRRR